MTMDLNTFITLFGWMTIINFGLLIFSTLLLFIFKDTICRLHQQISGLEASTLKPAYFYFLASYKLLILIFNLVPYIALKLL